MQDLLFSTTFLASFLGGIVALLAPCCVSAMLPAHFASSFRSRTHILGMTLVFAAGVATVILPIGLGATELSRLISGQHTLVFSIGGAAMLAGGVTMLAGKFILPIPGLKTGGGTGIGSVYSLGALSGNASSCCAPVLATLGIAEVTPRTQGDCAYSDSAKEVLRRLGRVFPLQVTEIGRYTDDGRELATRYGNLFAPGILLDGRGFGYGRLSQHRVRKELTSRSST